MLDMTVLSKGHPPLPTGARLRSLVAGAVILPDGFDTQADQVVVDWRGPTGSPQPNFNAARLVDFLSFLELAVFHERLLYVSFAFTTPLGREILTDEVLRFTGARMRLGGRFPISADTDRRLEDAGVIVRRQIPRPIESPRELLSRYASLSPTLREVLESTPPQFLRDTLPPLDDNQRQEFTFFRAMSECGEALVVSEFARSTGTPYHCADTLELRLIDESEAATRASVLSMLHNHLDEGARAEAVRLTELGAVCEFPQTPVAAQIVQDSKTPDDLVQTCLSLRDEWGPFRREMISVEKRLLAEDMTLERRLKLLDDLEAAAAGIWKRPQEGGLRQHIREISGLVPALTSAAALPTPAGVSGTLAAVLGMPVDSLLQAMRRRKLRVVHRAKKRFLQSAGLVSHLARMFEVPKETVRDSIAHYHAGNPPSSVA